MGLRKLDPLRDYGIIPRQPRPADTVYVLDYDPRWRYLKLNGVVVRQFQLESHADVYFGKLFRVKGWVKRVKVDKPARASILINNTDIPKPLRDIIFDSGNKETSLVAYTVIRRSEAQKVNRTEIDNWLVQKRDEHYSLLKTGKRK